MFGLDQRGPTYNYLKSSRELKPSINNHIIDKICFPFTENLSCHDLFFFSLITQRINAPNVMSMHTVKMENVSAMEDIMEKEYEESVSVLEVCSRIK